MIGIGKKNNAIFNAYPQIILKYNSNKICTSLCVEKKIVEKKKRKCKSGERYPLIMIERHNIVMMLILPNLIYKFGTIPIRIKLF